MTEEASVQPTDEIKRDNNGRWVKGTKAPYNGGSRWRKTKLAYAMFEEESEDIIRSVIERAKEGDSTAMKLVVDRIVPPLKSAPIKIELPPVTSSEEAKNAIATVLAAQCAGEITQDEAEGLLRTIDAFVRVCGLAELEAKVNALSEIVGK